MGDFAILLRSGFDRWQATKAQIITGLGGMLGACAALLYSNSIHSMSIHSLNIHFFSLSFRYIMGITIYKWSFSLCCTSENCTGFIKRK
jgi:zinc transporter 13